MTQPNTIRAARTQSVVNRAYPGPSEHDRLGSGHGFGASLAIEAELTPSGLQLRAADGSTVEIFIAGHDDVGPAGDSNLQELVVLGIATDLDSVLRFNGLATQDQQIAECFDLVSRNSVLVRDTSVGELTAGCSNVGSDLFIAESGRALTDPLLGFVEALQDAALGELPKTLVVLVGDESRGWLSATGQDEGS